MGNCKLQIVLIAALCGTAVACADEEEDRPRLPVIGRPEFFDAEDGPIGAFQTPVMRIEPSEVQVEDPVTVTIRVAAAGPVRRPPKQIRLEKLPGFSEQFYIEYPDDPVFRRVDDRTWEFTCTLKPRSTNVTAIPSFPFAFFTPGLLPAERGYQVHRTASVPLMVRPRAAVQPGDVVSGVDSLPIPESVFQLTKGPSVLRPASVWSLTKVMAVGAVGLFLPLVVCVIGCIAWRRLHPDTARHIRQCRSRAAQLALTALRGLEREEYATDQAPAIVTKYLQQRFDVPAKEPTPAEVGIHLRQAGCEAEVAEQAVAFFRAWDAARFAHLAAAEDSTLAAKQLILSLEGDACSSHASF